MSNVSSGTIEAPVPLADPVLRVVVCDDDAGVRSVVSDFVSQHVGEVLAETDGAADAIDLIERFRPDVAVLDLSLGHGSGLDVIEHLRGVADPPRVLLFTAFDDIIRLDDDFVDVIHTPDFDLLERQLVSTPARKIERRASRGPVRLAPPAVGGPDEFYRTLADARPDDVIVSVAVDAVDEADVLASVRRSVRGQDRVLLRNGQVVALLIGGGPDAAESFGGRLARSVPGVADRLRHAPVGDDSFGSFQSVTEPATPSPTRG